MDNVLTSRLEGKVAFVTGGSRGIGAATVRRLASEGADVAFTYLRNDGKAAEVVEAVKAYGRRGMAYRIDNANAAAVVDTVNGVADTFGRLDILVNNASLFPTGSMVDTGLDDFDHTIAVNVRAPFAASAAAARRMTDGGRIITIGSNVAERAPVPGLGLYTLSKTSLIGMVKGLARELGPRGITVNVVHPGPTDTDLNPADGPNAASFAEHTALGRYADPAEVAATVAHLASADAAYITGASILADGGFSI
ncbi:SDR family NAD(P)-dependent oxidoreductase [Phytoactinopolyspora halotolerans]|uniref:SDR family oxidoreductase n=1 Tax=Phytoactinopolyspora halotolerans TaxID=1981512 RepID=A0A6L9S344_9ACTN|nr:SDR family oxidoreductase [Phytoactinopolyspora halotolerans]NED99476.1 SDR family oxidoreductase [Phytoactinopolyspora halotolerans]